MEGVIEAFESMLGDSTVSGEIFEVPPGSGYRRLSVLTKKLVMCVICCVKGHCCCNSRDEWSVIRIRIG